MSVRGVVAAAGMAAQQDRMDAVSNDLANADTTGYKQVRVGFRDLLYGAGSRGAAAGVQFGVGAAATAMGRNESQGNMISTQQPLDVAISGPGFLAVRDLNGKRAFPARGRAGQKAHQSVDSSMRRLRGRHRSRTFPNDVSIPPTPRAAQRGTGHRTRLLEKLPALHRPRRPPPR